MSSRAGTAAGQVQAPRFALRYLAHRGRAPLPSLHHGQRPQKIITSLILFYVFLSVTMQSRGFRELLFVKHVKSISRVYRK